MVILLRGFSRIKILSINVEKDFVIPEMFLNQGSIIYCVFIQSGSLLCYKFYSYICNVQHSAIVKILF